MPITTSYPVVPARPAAPVAQGGPSLQVGGLEADLSETRRLVTVLFADLSGSTALAERLDPEDLRRILGSFFAALAQQIQRYEGTVDKYIGDAVMAVFGAPVAHEDDAARAISAALGMQAAITRLNDDLERAHGVRLRLRVGINTGEVVAGLLAGDVQSAYTVVGDTVNTAQRIESAAPAGEVLVDETTYRLARRAFELESVAPLTLKGKAQPVPAYRVVRRQETEGRAEGEPELEPLVGRDEELAQLVQALEDAAGGVGRLVLVVGEAGMGKTRLVRELRRRAPADVSQLAVRGASYETQTPYALIAHVLRGAFGVREGGGEAEARALVERALDGIGGAYDASHATLLLDVLGYGERSVFDPETRRRQLVGVLRRLLVRQCERGPLLLVLEDLHWMDAASAAVLAELAREIPRQRCLLLGTTRPRWTPPPWTAQRLELTPLGGAEARALVEEAFGGPVDGGLERTIIERTGGNPFFILEVARNLRESGVLEERNGRLTAPPGEMPRVPETVQELLEARLDRLALGPKRVLQPAAVVGRTFWERLLEQLVPQVHLAPELAVLERESFINRQPDASEPTYAFRHALIQEVAYQQLLQSQRRGMHRAVGEAIERLYDERLDEWVDRLAYHYGRSDDDAKALFWLVRAADRARALFANESALALYGEALQRATDGEGI
ncbi:MAG TPA: adenylate/guanylate cyclase domain-containing protein, partial [Chloroflexota bacterium]|nr:adenylate/guanylate cyclase domain-containing protein [Chloroflexota bacterium]